MLPRGTFVAGHDFGVELFGEVPLVGTAGALDEDGERAVGLSPERGDGRNGLFESAISQRIGAAKDDATTHLGLMAKTALCQVGAGGRKVGLWVVTGGDIVVHRDG